MLFTLSPVLGTTQRAAYPNLNERNPKKKNRAWIAQYGLAHAHDVLSRGDYLHWYHAAELNEKRLKYVFGQQETEQYERFLDPATRATDPTGISQRVDKRILRVVPKHVRILSDKLAEQEFDPSVTVVDERGEQEKEAHLDKIRLYQKQGAWAESQGVPKPADLPAEVPSDEEDLGVYAQSEYQHEDAVAMEQKISLCLTYANYEQIDRDVVLHFFAFGEGAQYAGPGPGGRPMPTMLLPHNCLFLPSAFEDYRDMRAGAHLDYLTLGQLRAEAGDELTPEQYEYIANNCLVQRTDNWYLPAGMGSAKDSGQVRVLRFSFLSEDDMVWKTSQDRNGNKVVKRKTADPNADFRGGDITRRTALNVYEGVLVLNTDFNYGCRLAVKQLRDMDNPLRGMLPYVAFTPGMLAGRNSCAMDEVMPIADFCQEQWLRLQEACLRAVPQGYNFDPEVLLESISMLKGNKASEGLDLKPTIEQFYRTGNTTSKRKARDGSLLPPAVTRNDTGVPTDVVSYWQNLRSGLQMLETIMSSNAVVSAATPNPEVTKGQSDLAVAGTMSSLGYLAHGKQAMFKLICRAMGIRIWLTEEKSPITGTLVQGNKAPTRVRPRPQLARRQFNFRVEKKPTVAEWQDFRGVLQRSLDAKEITSGDYAFLLEVDNIKEARRILAQRAKKNVQQKLAMDQQNQQATIQGQIQSAQEAEKAKQGTIQVQSKADMLKEAELTKRAVLVAEIYAQSAAENTVTQNDAKQEQNLQQQIADAVSVALGSQAEQEGSPQYDAYAGLQPVGAE